MATLMAPPKLQSEVQSQLSLVASRIRWHDVAVGALSLAGLSMAYVATMVLLDKWLDLAASVRQVAWIGFAALFAVVAARVLVRPFRRTINPLFAAKRIEDTLPDAKNGIVNYVDLQDAAVPESVRQAVTAKAAKHIAHADLSKAVESREMVWSGSVVAALVVLLAVLFLVLKPTVFGSLVNRALNPFSSNTIAKRTVITLVTPEGGHLVTTAGQPIMVAVSVANRVPDPTRPDRLRVMLRRNAQESGFEEVALEPAASGEWSVRIPDYLVQNGFLYRVAGGDAETAEYSVVVRPKPVFKAFRLEYDYPKYLNMKPETSADPHIDAYAGTAITLTAFANRDLKDGRLVHSNGTVVPGEVAGANRDQLRVKFTVGDAGTYRLFFTASTGEANVDAPPYTLNVIKDRAPVVVFDPKQIDGQTLPLNGLLGVDARATDDFGVDTLTLKIKIENGPMLAAKPYLKGASLKRDRDGTWPTAVDYKDSYPLAGAKNETGLLANLQPGMVLEYWVEAADNCSVPGPNRGETNPHFKVKLGVAVEDAKQKEDQAKSDDARRTDEGNHQKQQAEKNQNEPRPKKDGPQTEKNAERGNPQPQNSRPENNTDNNQDAQPDNKPENKQGGQPENKQGNPESKQGGQPDNKQGGKPDSKQTGQPDNKQDGPPDSKQAGQPDNKQSGTPDSKPNDESDSKPSRTTDEQPKEGDAAAEEGRRPETDVKPVTAGGHLKRRGEQERAEGSARPAFEARREQLRFKGRQQPTRRRRSEEHRRHAAEEWPRPRRRLSGAGSATREAR
jgi:hypothetical protein